MTNIFKALAAFQQEVPIIHKDEKGFNYKYTGLPTIFEVINPLLKKHGLGFTQLVNNGTLKTIVFHVESGEVIESDTILPIDSLDYVETVKIKDGKEIKSTVIMGFEGMNKAQAYGSLITYFRRYAISTILGLITDTDSDARNKRIEDKNKAKNKPVFDINHKQWAIAINSIKNGEKTIEEAITIIKQSCELSKENEKLLRDEAI